MTLPSGFMELTYIQSTGTQYIDTGVKATWRVGYALDFRLTKLGQRVHSCVMGGILGDLMLEYRNQTGVFEIYRNNLFAVVSEDWNQRVRAELDAETRVAVLACENGTHTEDLSRWDVVFPEDEEDAGEIYLFGYNARSGADSRPGGMRLYGGRFYRDGALIREFVPCLHDGAAGLYDAVSGAFYTSPNGDAFIAGMPALITDRTARDAAERTEKGLYLAGDLNRVETAVSDLSGKLLSYAGEMKAYGAARGVAWDRDFDPPWDPKELSLTVKTNWTMADAPRASDMTRYLGNVERVAGAFGTALEYLESDGTQMIDTGIMPQVPDFRVFLDFQLTKSGRNQGIFGNDSIVYGLTGTQDRLYVPLATHTGGQSWSKSLRADCAAGVRYTLDITLADGVSTLVTEPGRTLSDGEYLGAEVNSTGPLLLFAAGNEWDEPYFSNMRLYRCKIWVSGALVRDYLPCRRGGETGLLDRCSGALFGNAGTGDFLAGPDAGSLLEAPLPGSMDSLTWQGANQIEAALELTGEALEQKRREDLDRLTRTAGGIVFYAGGGLRAGDWRDA